MTDSFEFFLSAVAPLNGETSKDLPNRLHVIRGEEINYLAVSPVQPGQSPFKVSAVEKIDLIVDYLCIKGS